MPPKAAEEKVPVAMRDIYNSITEITDRVCQEHLNDEYAMMCPKLAATLARKRPSPLTVGKPMSWACGIAYVLGRVNFLADRTTTPCMGMEALCAAFGVSKGTGSSRSKQIMDLLRVTLMDPNWTLPSRLDDNPMVWMLTVNGFPVDIRYMPIEVQEEAFHRGLIPYIPDETL
jgi:hypothetical protein